MRKALIALAGMTVPLPGLAQMPTPIQAEIVTPSAEAIELAKLLKPTSLPQQLQMPEEWELKETKRSFGTTILAWKGTPCDLTNQRCDAIATEIAGKMVRDRRAYLAKLAEYIYAVHFQRTLSPEDIKESIALAKTKASQVLLSSIMSIQSGKTFIEATNPYSGFVMKTPFPMWKDTPYREEFYDRTQGLPRAKPLVVPPPPRLPPSLRPSGAQ